MNELRSELRSEYESTYLAYVNGDDVKSFEEWLEEVKEFYGQYAISTSDGHDEDWTFCKTKDEADKLFEESKECGDVRYFEFSSEFGYEVIDSFWDGETGM